jgi:hypothetical protein
MDAPRIEVVFKKGKPVAVFLHLRERTSGKSGKTISLRPNVTAHFDGAGLGVGVELALPVDLDLMTLNGILHDLDAGRLEERDLDQLRQL